MKNPYEPVEEKLKKKLDSIAGYKDLYTTKQETQVVIDAFIKAVGVCLEKYSSTDPEDAVEVSDVQNFLLGSAGVFEDLLKYQSYSTDQLENHLPGLQEKINGLSNQNIASASGVNICLGVFSFVFIPIVKLLECLITSIEAQQPTKKWFHLFQPPTYPSLEIVQDMHDSLQAKVDEAKAADEKLIDTSPSDMF